MNIKEREVWCDLVYLAKDAVLNPTSSNKGYVKGALFIIHSIGLISIDEFVRLIGWTIDKMNNVANFAKKKVADYDC